MLAPVRPWAPPARCAEIVARCCGPTSEISSSPGDPAQPNSPARSLTATRPDPTRMSSPSQTSDSQHITSDKPPAIPETAPPPTSTVLGSSFGPTPSADLAPRSSPGLFLALSIILASFLILCHTQDLAIDIPDLNRSLLTIVATSAYAFYAAWTVLGQFPLPRRQHRRRFLVLLNVSYWAMGLLVLATIGAKGRSGSGKVVDGLERVALIVGQWMVWLPLLSVGCKCLRSYGHV